jgi:hypothetical protein
MTDLNRLIDEWLENYKQFVSPVGAGKQGLGIFEPVIEQAYRAGVYAHRDFVVAHMQAEVDAANRWWASKWKRLIELEENCPNFEYTDIWKEMDAKAKEYK